MSKVESLSNTDKLEKWVIKYYKLKKIKAEK